MVERVLLLENEVDSNEWAREFQAGIVWYGKAWVRQMVCMGTFMKESVVCNDLGLQYKWMCVSVTFDRKPQTQRSHLPCLFRPHSQAKLDTSAAVSPQYVLSFDNSKSAFLSLPGLTSTTIPPTTPRQSINPTHNPQHDINQTPRPDPA